MKNKVVSAAEAVAIIRDRDTVACSGFVGTGTPDELIVALEKRFLETGTPERPHAGVRGGAGRRQGPRPEPPRARGPGEARDRRPLVAGAQAGQARRREQDRGLQPAAGRDLLPLPRHRRAPRRLAHQGGPAHLRRSAPGRRQDQRAHDRGAGARDGDRRRGVPLLQGLPDHRGADPRHHRRPLRQHHHGARGAHARQPRHRHGGQELRRLRDRAGRAHRRAGRAQSRARSWCRACWSTAWCSRSRRTTCRPTAPTTTRPSRASSRCRSPCSRRWRSTSAR